MRKDVQFMKSIGLMDYSLLLAVEKIDARPSFSLNPDTDPRQRKYQIASNDSATYHVSIIDYLQDWNMNKKSERLIKTLIL